VSFIFVKFSVHTPFDEKRTPYDVLFYSKMCLASGYETLLTKQIKPG